MTSDTDEYSVGFLRYVSIGYDKAFDLAERRAYIYECYLKLMARLGAIVRNSSLLYWRDIRHRKCWKVYKYVDNILKKSTRLRRNIGRGRHRNIALNNSRWY